MNTNMTGFRLFSKNLCILVLWAKEASALEGLKDRCLEFTGFLFLIQIFSQSCIFLKDITEIIRPLSAVVSMNFPKNLFYFPNISQIVRYSSCAR